MHFEKDLLYHIYNQGNNRQKIFFSRENYLFFLKKVRVQVLPYCSVLAYCLMPNHFHFMVKVNEVELPVTADPNGGATLSRAPINTASRAPIKTDTLQKSIGILLASYTRAINKQEGSTGSLFRQKTKAECINNPDGVAPTFFNTAGGTIINLANPAKTYQQMCFNYIHQNPVKAGLVDKETEWEFSSASDYANLRHGTLVSAKVAREYVSWESSIGSLT